MPVTVGIHEDAEVLGIRMLLGSGEVVSTIQGIATTTAVTRTTSIASIIAGEILENGSTGYQRTNCKPATITTGYDATQQRTEVPQETFEATIPPTVTWGVRSIATIINARAWASRAVSAVDIGANTLTLTGTLPSAGDRVIVTTTGTLPGGIVDGTTYLVLNPSGSAIQLQPVGGGAAIDLTSAGTGTHTVRSVDGKVFLFRDEGATQNVSAKLLFLLDYANKGIVEVQ